MNHPDTLEPSYAAINQPDQFAPYDAVAGPSSLPSDLQVETNNDVHELVGGAINKVTSLQDALNPAVTPSEFSSALAA